MSFGNVKEVLHVEAFKIVDSDIMYKIISLYVRTYIVLLKGEQSNINQISPFCCCC